MGLRDRMKETAYKAAVSTDKTAATLLASQTADALDTHSAGAAVAASALGAATVARDAMNRWVYPDGDYATFRD
jgi:hypothetical protein